MIRKAFIAVSFSAAATLFSMAGLAYAGVTLPQPAADAFAKAGLTLPNATPETGDNSTPPDNHGQYVKQVATDGTTGCEHGQEVSAAARPEDAGNGPSCEHADADHGGDNGHDNQGDNGTGNNPTGNGPGSHPGPDDHPGRP